MARTPRPRKTVKLADLVDQATKVAIYSPAFATAQREAINDFIAHALESANAYAGYDYLPSEIDSEGRLRQGYDDSRRKYSKRLLEG